MSISSGTRLGPYVIAGSLGVGGMGEVYRATDTTLERQVAIKVLPDSFAQDAERVARFEREAKTLASLNHSNIAQIYGIEKGAVTAIAMELVDGPTLADRIAQGPLPPDEALNIARQILDALEAAHDKGIVHRDLKPANIKIKDDGLVKILDFGIAKSIDASASSGRHSPTIVTPAMTEAGVIMGTAAYMSPEQARGKFVDQRTDIWAFGCVLYEMLTGQPVFMGEDVMVVMASILRDKSDLSALPQSIAPSVRNTIKLCLEKDPKKRFHHVGDVRLALAGAMDSSAVQAAQVQHSSPLQFWLKGLPLALALSAVLAGGVYYAMLPEPVPAPRVQRFAHELPEGRDLLDNVPGVLDIAPDGRRLAYNSSDGLVIRDLDTLEDRVLPGTQGRYGVHFSPDGESIAYATLQGSLVRRTLNADVELELASVPGQNSTGMRWQADGNLLFSISGQGIYRVSENGGEPERIVEVENGVNVGAAQLLPGSEWVLFTRGGAAGQTTPADAQLVVQSLVTGERKPLRQGAFHARYVNTGHLVFLANGALFGVGFDLATLEPRGTPVPLVRGIRDYSAVGLDPFALAANGTLVYVPGRAGDSAGLTLGLNDGQGRVEELALPAGNYANARVAPNGRWIAVEAQYSDGTDIAVIEVGSNATPRRLTFGGGNTRPQWSADGSRVAYAAARTDGAGIYWRLADGSGAEEQLTEAAAGTSHAPDHFSPDGHILAFTSATADGSAIWQLVLASREASVLIEAPGGGASHAAFSPDGRWLAYQAYDSGDNEVYVQPFPLTGAKFQVPNRSDNHHPAWSPDGRQLYYIPGPGRFERVDIATERGVSFGSPTVLTLDPLAGNSPVGARTFDIMPDGRVLGTMPKGLGGSADRNRIVIVLNWTEELKRLVPTGSKVGSKGSE